MKTLQEASLESQAAGAAMVRRVPGLLPLSCMLGAVCLISSACSTVSRSGAEAAKSTLKDAATERQSLLASQQLPPADAEPVVYVRYALLRHPGVHAAFGEWRASVAAIGPAGALPDPQLTFQADIDRMVMSLMPGVMFDIMLPGKRAAMARMAAAGSEVARRNYVGAAAAVADGVNRELVELAFLEEALRLKEAARELARQARDLALADYRSGAGMGDLEAQLRATTEVERLASEQGSLLERRRAARLRLKAALGLLPGEADPGWPSRRLGRTELPSREELWRRIQEYNTDLARMRAMVEMAVAQEVQAGTARTPDFTAGLMADVKQAPWMWRPTATMTLPVWRSKIRGQLEAASARREAAAEAVNAELISMSAELARMLFMIDEADRMVAFLDGHALPSVRRTLASAQATVRSGMGRAAMIPESRTMEYAMLQERNEALRERELAVADLARMTGQLLRESGVPHLSR